MRGCRRTSGLERLLLSDEGLEPEWRQHVTSCAPCRDVKRAVDHLDAELPGAAASLRGPDLPGDTLLAARQFAPSGRWTGSAVLPAIAASLVTVVLAALIGVGAGQLLSGDGGPRLGVGSEPQPTSPYRHAQRQFLELLTACLRAEGVDATLQEDGGIHMRSVFGRDYVRTDGGMHTRGVFGRDYEACAQRIDPARLLPPPPLTDAQWVALYRYALAQGECLRALGYDVAPAPSLAEWRATDRAWDPLVRNGTPIARPQDVARCQKITERPEFLDW